MTQGLVVFLALLCAATLRAQDFPSVINAALYDLTNEGVDTIIVYFPAFNDQIPTAEQEKQPYYLFWQRNGRQFQRKFANMQPAGEVMQSPDAEITTLAAEHLDEIENEEILQPYYRQYQDSDTVWIMFPPTNYLKDIFLIQADGRRIVKMADVGSLDAKEFFAEGVFNIHFEVNAALFTTKLRKNIIALTAEPGKRNNAQNK